MSRDFSKEKKEELYRALDTLDEREWKPFMVWCGRRADEFGEWAERLGISSYTKQIDHFQDRVLEINNSTRNQIDIVFEEVAETDRRYADTLWGHAETVREQVRRVQVMLQAMQSADRNGTERKVLLQGLRPQAEISHEEWLERGQRVLRSYLKVRGITDSAEQQEICDLIMEKQSGMLASLYLKDYHGEEDAAAVYNSMMEYCIKYKMKISFISYLEESGITDSKERQKIYDLIMENQPSILKNLCYNREDFDKAYNPLINYYDSHYFGKYPYPVAYIEGIIKAYETHKMVDGRFVLDNGGKTIGYGHDVRPGEDFSKGLSEAEAFKLAITDLDEKYGVIIRCIEEINGMTGMNIDKKNFSENEMIFFLDFAYNRGKGLVKRPELSEDQPHTSLALLIIAVSEGDDEKIISILKEEVKNRRGEYLEGLEKRRMDEYEILKKGDYIRDDDMERGAW